MSGSIEITPELLAGFLDEAPEYLDMLDAGLMELESQAGAGVLSLDTPEDQERMTTMFRAAHSLKGLAAAFGFDKIKELTHRMETLFDQVRMGQRGLSAESFELLFRVFDRLKALLAELTEPAANPVDIADMLAELDVVLQSKPAPHPCSLPGNTATQKGEEGTVQTAPDPVATAAPTAAPAACEPAPSLEALGMFADPELVSLFLETTAETIDELNQGLLGLEAHPEDAELLNRVFRCAHNIKGASGAAGLTGMNRITHDMETVFDALRSRSLTLCDELMNAVFRAVDRLREVVDQLKCGRANDVAPHELTDLFSRWTQRPPGDPVTGAAGPSEVSTPTVDTPNAASPSGNGAPIAAAPAEPATPGCAERVFVVVTFPPAFDEAVIQSYLIFNKLSDLGNRVTSTPDLETLAPDAELVRVAYTVTTDADPAQVEEIVSAYHIDGIGVRRGSEPSELHAPIKKMASVAGGAAPGAAVPTSEPTLPKQPPRTEPRDTPTSGGAPSPRARSEARGAESATIAAPSPPRPGPPASGRSATPAEAKTDRPAVKSGETLRVDQERLDELMNLGGELVINRARFAEIHGKFRGFFDGKNLGYLVDDLTEHIAQLGQSIDSAGLNCGRAHDASTINSRLRHLGESIQPIRALVRQFHELRGSMVDFDEALHGLTRVSEGIQRGIMGTRMVAIGPLFNRFRRVVRDITKVNGKQVELILRGENTELDKRMIDELGDPLTHMVRNSVDHGIESPETRSAAGKNPIGTLTLSACHRGNSICIEVIDDGAGINIERVKSKVIERALATPAQVAQMTDRELTQFIFKPGFSTAQVVTEVSGRGMGMDIVVNKIEKLSGTVEVDSTPGAGTRVIIKLPLTLAILTSMVAKIGRGIYAIPLETVAEIITVPRREVQSIQRRQVVRVRDRVVRLAWFEDIFATTLPGLRTAETTRDDLTLVIIGFEQDRIGLVVDALLGQEDVVIKSIAENYRNVRGIAGASIRGDGTVSLILDVAAMIEMAAKRARPSDATSAKPSEPVVAAVGRA